MRRISFQDMEAVTLQTIYQTGIQSILIPGDKNCRMGATCRLVIDPHFVLRENRAVQVTSCATRNKEIEIVQ